MVLHWLITDLALVIFSVKEYCPGYLTHSQGSTHIQNKYQFFPGKFNDQYNRINKIFINKIEQSK